MCEVDVNGTSQGRELISAVRTAGASDGSAMKSRLVLIAYLMFKQIHPTY